MDVINDLRKSSPKAIKVCSSFRMHRAVTELVGAQTIFFVGGFSSSDFLFNEMSRYIAEDVALDGNEQISVCRPDRHLWVVFTHDH